MICRILALISLLFEPFCSFSQTPFISLKPLLSNECNCLIHLLPFFLNLKTVLNIDFWQMQPQLSREPTSPSAGSWRPALCCLMPATLLCSAQLIPVLPIGRRRLPCLRSQQPPWAEHTLCDPQPHISMSSVPKKKVMGVMELFSCDCQREESCGHGQWQWAKQCRRGQRTAAALLELLVALHSP